MRSPNSGGPLQLQSAGARRVAAVAEVGSLDHVALYDREAVIHPSAIWVGCYRSDCFDDFRFARAYAV